MVWYNSQKVLIPSKIRKASSYLSNNEVEKAHDLLDKLPKNVRKEKMVTLLYYAVYKSKKQYFLAIYELEKILNQKEVTPAEEVDLREKKAALFDFLNKSKEAYQEYEKILQINPNNLEANFKMGKYLFDLKYYKTAKIYLTRVLEGKGDFLEAREMIFEILIDEKNYDEAKEVIETIIEFLKKEDKPVSCKSMHRLALANYFVEDYKTALSIIENIDESYQENEELNLIKALSLYEMDAKLEANPIFEKILHRHVDNYDLIFLRSRYAFSEILFSIRDVRGAVEQVDYIARYEKPYLDNRRRKLIFDQIVEADLLPLMYDNESKDFIAKAKAKQLGRSNNKLVKILTHGKFLFSLVFKRLDNSHEIFIYHFNITPLSLYEWNEVIEAINPDYGLKLNRFFIHSFFEIGMELKEKYASMAKVEEKIGIRFIEEVKDF